MNRDELHKPNQLGPYSIASRAWAWTTAAACSATNSSPLLHLLGLTAPPPPPPLTLPRNLSAVSSEKGEGSHTNPEKQDQSKICSAEQFEEITISRRASDGGVKAEPVTFQRQSLRALMAAGDPDTVFDQYYGAYSECFTNKNEVEDKTTLRELLEIGKGDWDISVLTRDDTFVAGYHTKLVRITAHDMGLFSVGDYLWTSKEMRGLGLGELLYNRTMDLRRSQGAQGHFGEIRDVLLLPATELYRDKLSGTTSKQRIGFWKKQNREVLDAPWLQPPLSEGKKEIDFYMLTMSQLTDSCPLAFPREAYLELWKRFYPLHKTSSTFERLGQMTEDTSVIRLIPITQTRTFIKEARETNS